MMKGSLVYTGLGVIDIVMLEILGNKEFQVGQFSAVVTIAGFLLLFNEAINLIFAPLVHSYKDDVKKFQHMLNKGSTIKIIPTVLLYLVMIFFGKNLLGYFGPEYVESYIPLVIIATANFLYTILGFPGILLFYTEHLNKYVSTAIIQLTVVMVLDFLLIPRYQLMGAVIAFAAAEFVTIVLNTYHVRRLMGLRVFYVV